MKIGVNARFLLPKMEGFGWFSFEVIKRLCIQHPEHQFILFFDRKFDARFVFSQNVTPVVLNPPARHPFLFKIWFDYSIKKALKKYAVDVFFSPDGYLSLTTDIPQIPVIHDIYFEHHPKALKKRDYQYLHTNFPKFAHKANHIITVSAFSKADIVAQYKIDPKKIDIAYNGASEDFSPIGIEEKNKVRQQFSNNLPYFLFVGAVQPRKNLSNLLLAFERFKTTTKSDYLLLVVGGIYMLSPEMKTILNQMKHRSAVVFTGHLDKSDLTKVMGTAEALTFVSYFEGFGIPIVEAMKCACPVLVGNRTSSPEIAGEAALMCDPFDVESIQQNLTLLASDADLKNELRRKGLKRVQQFTWDNTAASVWNILEITLQNAPHGTLDN